MRQIIYGCIALLQDPRFVKYDKALDKWYLDENAWNIECCAVANAGAVGIRLLPWGPWGAHPYGIKSQFQPYALNADCTAFNLGAFNNWYFPTVKRVIEIANTYGLKVWWAWGDNCQFSGAYRKWSPWVTNTQGITSCYEPAAYPFIKTWIQKCRDEFAGLGVAWAWGNEMNDARMDELVRACIFPILPELDPKMMTYGAHTKDAPYVNGNYEGDAGMLDLLKKITGLEFGDPMKLVIWKETHSVGGKGYPAKPNRLDQALYWWAREADNGIRIWLSDDGVFDGDSACDFDIYNGKLRRRPSAARWAEVVKMTLKYGNDFTYEHLPKTEDLACITATVKAIYKAVYGKDPVEKYHYTPPVEPPEPPQPPEPPVPPTPPVPPHTWMKDNWGWVAAVILAALILVLL